MTPITIERELLERAKDALIESVDLVRHDYENDWRHRVPTRKAQLEGSRLALEAHEKVIHDICAALAAPEEGPSATSITLAATILSDCGISTDYVSLHERVAARITKYADELLATWKRLQAPATAPSHTEAEVQELLHDDREMTEERFEISVRRILGVPAP